MHLHIHVIHATHLNIRLPIMNQLLEKIQDAKIFESVSMELVIQFDPKDLDINVIRQFVSLTKQSGSDFFNEFIKNMHIKQVSNALKHFIALRKVDDATNADSVRANNTMFLVLEDDVVYGDDIANRLYDTANLVKNYTKPWDIIMLGTPSVQAVTDGTMEITPVKSMFRVMPCCDSYFVNPRTVSNIVSKFLPIHFATNLQFSFIGEKHKDINIMMTVPNIFVDGSKLGIYISNITPNNKLFLNKEYNKLHNLIHKDGVYTLQEREEIENGLKTIRFANHPDIMYLNALFLFKIGNAAQAEKLYAQAHQIYQQNDAVMNNESEFILNYTRVYRDLQKHT